MPAVRLYELQKAGASSSSAAPSPFAPAALSEITEHTLDLDASNARGRPQWSAESVRAAYNLSSLAYGPWRAWALGLQADDAAFARLMSPQRCADEIDAEYGTCKASYLCAMLEPEPSPYAACLKRLRKRAVAPPGWVAAVKRQP